MRRLLVVLLFSCAKSEPAAAPSADMAARAAFEQQLEPYGRWEEDARWGRRWCPRDPPPGEAAFVAFRNYGHWESGPRWVTSRPGTWLETTTTRGAWIYRQASDEWCWIPGNDPPAFAWKKGLGFVGWAPLPPSKKVEDVPDRAFTYTMLGLLYDPWLTTLTGEARTDAMTATRLSPAPSNEEVASARAELLARAGLHEGNELPPAQALWALSSGAPQKTPEPVEERGTPIGAPMQNMPNLGDLGQLQGLLSGMDPAMLQGVLGADGGLPFGRLPPQRPPTKK